MRKRSGGYRLGERYVLQCAGGIERIAEVGHAGSPELTLVPPAYEEPLPEPRTPCGEWRIEPGERLVRDWAGRYWSVAWRADRGPVGGRPRAPYGWTVEFTRFTPEGEPMSYGVASARPPGTLSDAEVVRLLRLAWDSLATDRAERLRRAQAAWPEGIEL